MAKVENSAAPSPLPSLDGASHTFELHLCQGSRFDISALDGFRGSIEPRGAGTIYLGPAGANAKESYTRAIIKISGDSSPHPVTISIPAGADLKPDAIKSSSFVTIVNGLQAEIHIGAKGQVSSTGATLNFEVRGEKGTVTVPFLRDGELAHSSVERFLNEINTVR